MRQFNYFSITLFLSLGLMACCKLESTSNEIDCIKLKQGLLQNEYSSVKSIIDTLCTKYLPIPTLSDPLGHEKNTELLVKEINDVCLELKVALKCYACQESLPVQSSLFVELDSSGFQIVRHFSIYVPEGKIMYFNN